jgi:hypothetical protein
MNKVQKMSACLLAAFTMGLMGINAQLITTGTGTATVSTTPGSISVAGDINLSAVSTVQSPTQLVLRSGASYLSVLPVGAGTTLYSPTQVYLAGANSRTIMATSGAYAVQTFSYNTTPIAPATTTITGGIFNFTTGTGYVKIGAVTTPNPAGYKLYVDQGILTEKVKIAVAGSANWADYVFAKDYKLMPLSEVEQFVKINKHLPNVLSAAEMVKEGNDLGKTDAKLLEKIEELTLYMIELKKSNDSVLKKVDRLEADNKKLTEELEQLKKRN